MFDKNVEVQIDYADYGTTPPSFTDRLLAVHTHRKQTSGTFTKAWLLLSVPLMWTLFVFAVIENLHALFSIPFIFVASAIVVVSCFSLWGKLTKFALRKNLVGGVSATDRWHNRRVAQSALPALEQIDADFRKRSKVIFVGKAPRKGQGSFGNIFTSVLVVGIIFTLVGIAPIIVSIMQYGWGGFYKVYINDSIYIMLILFLFIGVLFVWTTLYNAIWAMKIKRKVNKLFSSNRVL